MLSNMGVTPEDLRRLYLGNKPVSEENLMEYSTFLGDVNFVRNIMEIADIEAKLNNNTTYLYQFSYESETSVARKLLDLKLSGIRNGHKQYLINDCRSSYFIELYTGCLRIFFYTTREPEELIK